MNSDESAEQVFPEERAAEAMIQLAGIVSIICGTIMLALYPVQMAVYGASNVSLMFAAAVLIFGLLGISFPSLRDLV